MLKKEVHFTGQEWNILGQKKTAKTSSRFLCMLIQKALKDKHCPCPVFEIYYDFQTQIIEFTDMEKIRKDKNKKVASSWNKLSINVSSRYFPI